MIKDKNTPWYPVTQDHLLLHKAATSSSWAECLDKDEYRFIEEVVYNPLFNTSQYSKERRDEIKGFRSLLEAFCSKPRSPLGKRDYNVIRRRKDLQKLGIVVSALSLKKGLIPFSEEDLLKLKQLFTDNYSE
jgi:hypothetical protein